MLVTIILTLVVLVNGVFVFYFIRDLIAHKGETMKEPGNPIALSLSTAVIYLLSTFGISDFAISTAMLISSLKAA